MKLNGSILSKLGGIAFLEPFCRLLKNLEVKQLIFRELFLSPNLSKMVAINFPGTVEGHIAAMSPVVL